MPIAEDGIYVSDIVDSGEVVVKLKDRIYGRYVTVVVDKKTGEIILEAADI